MYKLALIWTIGCVECMSTGCRQQLVYQSDYAEYVAWRVASDADKAAGRTDGVTAAATMTYWMGIKAALHPAPIDTAIAAEDIGKLSTMGVDLDLLLQGRLVADKMQAAASSINSMPAYTILFRVPFSRWNEAEALSKAVVEQCHLIERMRPELTARYGVEFPSLDVSKP